MAGRGLALPPNDGSDCAYPVRTLARHFVRLQFEVHPPGKPSYPAGISGFVAEEAGEWFMVTAGHCLALKVEGERQGYRYTDWHLDDAAGSGSRFRELGPFAFAEAKKDASHDEEWGTDFAVIHLRQLYRLQLAANGIVPLTRAAWQTPPRSFEQFLLLGVPYETIVIGTQRAETFKGVRL